MRLYLVGALAAFLMVGCGGSSEPKQPEAVTSLQGVAVDDLIVNGVVEAYAASNTSNVLATGRTSATDGSYTLDVSYDGVVVVKVTCDANSLMKNPVDGTTKACESGLELHSATAVTPQSEEIKVNISPLSELMVRQMNQSGTTVENLEAAQNNIGLMFGLDPVAESPVTHDTYSDIIGAIHDMADSDTSKTILDVIDDISADLEDGEAGDDGNITAQLAEAMEDAGVSNNLTNNDGIYTPPTNGGSMSDIAQSKAFFNELRTQAMSVVDYDNTGTPGFLDTEAANLGTALEDVALNTGIAGEYVAEAVTEILNAIDDGRTTGTKDLENSNTRTGTVTQDATDPKIWTYSVQDDGVEVYSGTVTFSTEIPQNASPADLPTAGLTASFEGTVPMRELPNSNSNTVTDTPMQVEFGSAVSTKESRDAAETGVQTFVTNMTLTKTTAGADFVLSDATLSAGAESIGISNLSISTGYDYNATDDKTTMNFVKLNSMTLSGIVSGYSMSGTLAVPAYVSNSSLADKAFVEESYRTFIYGQIICTDGGDRAEPNDAAAVFTDINGAQHTLNVDSNGYINSYEGIEGDLFGEGEGGFSTAVQVVPDSGDYSNYTGATFDGLDISSNSCTALALEYVSVYVDGEENFYNSANLPKEVTFTGNITNTATTGSLTGTLSVDWLNAATIDLSEESNDKPSIDVAFNGTLKMPSRPDMVLNLGYTNPGQNNNFTFSYSYDATVINGSGIFDEEMENGTIVLTNHLGLEATIKQANGETVYGAQSSVKKGGKVIGELQEREDVPVIKYIDGSFESLP